MQTGYDSFWMYQNNRQESVLNLPKNDYYSQAVLTDNYKQMQNGGPPSYLNSYIPSQSNVARSDSSNQYRAPSSQYLWQYSVCSMPLKPSYVNNYQPQTAFSNESNNTVYLAQYSQAQQNFSDASVLRNFKDPNTDVSPVYSNSNNHSNNGNSVPASDIQNTNTQTPRIRVRDVFTLNKSSISSQILNDSSYPTHQKEQHEYALNFVQDSACTVESQRQCANYGRNNLPQLNHQIPYYQSTGKKQPQQPLQNSSSFCQQNIETQHQFGISRPMGGNVNLETSKTNTHFSSTLQKLIESINEKLDVQNGKRNSSESLHGGQRVKIMPSRNSVPTNNSGTTNTSRYGDPCDVNNRLPHESSNMGSFPQNQRQEVVEASSFRSNCITQGSNGSTPAGTKSPAYQQNPLDNTVVKITIPHKGQSTYVTVSDYANTNKNPNLSLPSLLEENENGVVDWGQNNMNNNSNAKENGTTTVRASQIGTNSSGSPHGPTNVNPPVITSPKPQQNCQNEPSARQTVPLRKRFLQVKEPIIDLNKENLEEFLKSTSSVNSETSKIRKKDNITRETIFQNEITLRLKQENFSTGVESSVDDHNNTSETVTNERVLLGIIKTEKNSVETPKVLQEEGDNSVEQKTEGELHTSETELVQDTEFDRHDIKEFVIPHVTPEPEAVVNLPGNYTQKVATSALTKSIDLDLQNNNSKKKIKNSSSKGWKKYIPREGNYECKINREKLDKLIQFLEKDEETAQISLGPPIHKHKGATVRKKQMNLNHSRRKLSKTCIVKNKNNSREMISMKSNKTARVELPESPQNKKLNSDKHGVIMVSSANDESKVEEKTSEKCNTSNPLQEDSLKSESKESVKKQFEGTSKESASQTNFLSQRDEFIVSKILSLQGMESVFCRNCDLVAALDSFWINLSSGELKCLNCFKKIIVKYDQNNYISNNGKNSEGNPAHRDMTENRLRKEINICRESPIERIESDMKDINRTKGSSKSERSDVNSKNENEIKKEILDSSDGTDSEKNFGHAKKVAVEYSKSSRRSTDDKPSEKVKNAEEHKKARKEIPVEQTVKTDGSENVIHKTKHSGDVSKGDGRSKRKLSSSKESCVSPKPPTSTTPKQLSETVEKSERKNTPKDEGVSSRSVENLKKEPSSDQSLKKSSKELHMTGRTQDLLRKSISRDEEGAEEQVKRERKGTECSSQSRRKSDPKDCHKLPEEYLKKSVIDSLEKTIKKPKDGSSTHKDTVEQTTKKSIKLEHSEKAKVRSPSRENCHKPKEPEELKAKNTSNTNDTEKHRKSESAGQSRKRKNSDDIFPVKVRVVEDQTRKDITPGPHKTSTSSTSKEDIARHKHKTETEMQATKNLVDKTRRDSSFKDESERRTKEKEGKQVLNMSNGCKVKEVVCQKAKVHEYSKPKAGDSIDIRRKSQEELAKRIKIEVKQVTESSESRKSSSKERSPKPRIEEFHKTKHNSVNTEKNHIKVPNVSPTDQPRKSETMSGLLVENQNTKTKNTATEYVKLKHEDLPENKREHKKSTEDRNGSKKARDKEAAYKKSKREGKYKSDKKKYSDCSEKKYDKSQTENKHSKSLEKAEFYLGIKTEDECLTKTQGGRPSSPTLLEKLKKKTKELSRSLLSEA